MSTRTISFAEIVQGRDATVRVTSDGMIYAVDLVMIMTGKNCNDSNECLRELSSSLFNKEKFLIRSRSRLVSFEHALELVMVLPGKVAKETRTKFASIIKRYMAGDGALVDEINANAQSDAPIPQMARASLAADAAPAVVEPVQDTYALARKRKLEELEIEKLELDISIRRREAEVDLLIKRREAELEYASKITSTYRDLCEDTVMDTRARLMLKDYYLNMVIPQQPLPVITADGEGRPVSVQEPSPPPSRPISLSQVATQLGLKIPTNHLISLGGTIRKRYEAQHGHAPPKHDQLCDGRMTKVNSYSEADRPLVEEVLQEWQRINHV